MKTIRTTRLIFFFIAYTFVAQGQAVYTLVVSPNGANLIAGTTDRGIWTRPLSQMTSVERLSSVLPMHFSLDQNYPNPFNPTTIIGYQIAVNSKVKLIVYDLLGREIVTLVDEEKAVGSYTMTFNAVNFKSGVYFYCLHAGEFVETKRLLIIK